jgi:hypothetical protein
MDQTAQTQFFPVYFIAEDYMRLSIRIIAINRTDRTFAFSELQFESRRTI